MPARNVIRPTLANRFSNTPASNPATINAAQQNQSAPNAMAQTGAGPVAATRSTPQGFQGTGYVQTVQMPRNVTFTTPNGAKGIIQLSSNGRAKITSNPQYTEPIKQNGKVIGTGTFDTAIVNGKLASQIIGFKGNTLTEPVSSTANTSIGTLTEKGTINYQYALQGSELVPKITSTTGGIFYQSQSMQSKEAQAQSAISAAKANLQEVNNLRSVVIPLLVQQVNTAYEHNNPNYGKSLMQNLQFYSEEANKLANAQVFSSGTYAGYNPRGVIQAAGSTANANKPVEIATLTTAGLAPLATTVGDAIYGKVSGKTQQLGTLEFKPTESNGSISLAYAGFKPSEVQVSGPGWYAGIYTSFNPNTGKIAVNPKNYAYVTGNLQTGTLPNGEVVSSITMPSGFGLNKAYGQGALNYLNIANIPVTNGQYTATESYTSQGNNAFYTLTNPGGFPYSVVAITTLGKGVSEVQKQQRQFNPLTGAISYISSSTFAIPGIGSIAVPTSSPLTEIYNYKNKQYTFSFNPAASQYSISLNSTGMPTSSGTSTESIQYNFGANGTVTGYSILNAQGTAIGGGDYLTPKFVAEGNVTQPTFVGNTLVLPKSEYASYISNQNANTKASLVNAKLSAQNGAYTSITSPLNNILFYISPGSEFLMSSEEHAAWDAFSGGELTSQGYTIQGVERLGKGLAIGEAPVFIIAAPVASLTNAGISVTAQGATNVATGKPITNNLLLAGSLGADFGSIFGATIPEGTSAVNVAKTVGLNAVKMGVGFGAFNAAVSVSEVAFGGNPATSSGATGGISPRSQALGAAGKSQSSFSLLGNYTPSEYLNVGISSFMHGFTTGTEFAGGFGAAQNELAAYAKSSTAAKTALRLMQNKPLVSGTTGTFTFGTTLASGGTLRQAVVGGIASSAFMYGFMGLSEQFNPQLKLGTAKEPSTVIAIRPGPEEQASGTVITGMKDYNDMIISPKQQDIIKNVALKVDLNNIQAQSDIIAKTMGAPKPSVEVTSGGRALGSYNPAELKITINSEQPKWELSDTLIHENLHNFFENGNLEIVRSYRLTPDVAKGLNNKGYASVASLSVFKEEGATFDLTSRILSGKGGVYLNSAGGFTDIGSTESGLMRSNQYSSLEYLKAVRTPFKNGNILDVGTGAIRTLTGEATVTAPEVSDIFSGQMKVERTITINPTRIQRFFGIGPKVITQDFFTETPQEVSTLLSNNPTIVVSQPGGIETTPELKDVYKTAAVKPEGPTTIFHQSIATPEGQEWLGETGKAKDFNLVGKTSKFVMLEVGPNSALPSAEDLFAGRPGEMKASPYEGPKPTGALKPFDVGLDNVGKIESPISPEPTVETGNGETQLQTTKTIPKSQAGAASSIFSARMPAYINAGNDVINVFPLISQPSRASHFGFQPKSIFKEPTIAPTSKPVSISGVDPYALAQQLTSSELINGSYNTQKQNAITNTNRQSNLNPLGNMLYSSSRSNLLFGSRVGLSNKMSYGVSTKVTQKQSQKQTQKQSQKQTQKNAYRNPPPTIAPPAIPNYLYGAFAPDQRIKPPKPKAQKAAPPQKGPFKYINDLTSAMFNIHGSKKNKVYGALGFFRPL